MKAIHMQYDSRYQFSKFKGYMKTIMKNNDKKKGIQDAIEPFYNRKRIKSPAYAQRNYWSRQGEYKVFCLQCSPLIDLR